MEDVAKQLIMDYKATFSTEPGLRVLDDLRRYCFFNATTYAPESHVMVFREGSRDVVLRIDALIAAKPDAEEQNVTSD